MNKNELLEMIPDLEEDDYTLVSTKAIVKKLMAYAKLLDSACDLVEAVSEYRIENKKQNIADSIIKIEEQRNALDSIEQRIQQSTYEIVEFRADRLKSHKATFEEMQKGTLNG